MDREEGNAGTGNNQEGHSEAFLFCSCPINSSDCHGPPQQPHRYGGSKEGSRMPTLISEEANRSEVDAVALPEP